MRDEFPIFKKHPGWIYLDTAATAQKPQCVIDALMNYYTEDCATVHRAIYKQAIRAGELYDQTREEAARFLNAGRDEIVFTRGTTDGLNLVARSYGKMALTPGDEILISEMEHHSNFVPWQMIAAETGAHFRLIPVDDRGVLQWEGLIHHRTKIVAVAHISNVTGTVNPLKQMAEAAHAVGAVLVVDGAQAAPHMKIDVQALGCDFYAFSGHKCYGPTGVGVLFGKQEHLERMPPIQGGGDMIAWVERDKTTYQSPPLRFEAGTPIIASVIALGEALRFVQRHQGHTSPLRYATQRLQQAIPHLRIIGTAPEKGPLITFHIEGVHPLDLATYLDMKNISIRSGHLCAQPLLRRFGLESAARVSFGLYNTTEEVDCLIDAIQEMVESYCSI
ncbi:MAG: cysteine desulfurase [Verrucomicrobia bacterium]|nr:cysteine desulfurase [Verrucomicrobiota bacterium]MBU6446904.1 cysteine desulfurase [Verrucomicrobiota bacterium]MDE3047844.1 cysteine desulfurase [Verrucomicrobiota bacterium]